MSDYSVRLKLNASSFEREFRKLQGGLGKAVTTTTKLERQLNKGLTSAFRNSRIAGVEAGNQVAGAWDRASKKAKQFGRDAQAATIKAKRSTRGFGKGASAGILGAGAFSGIPGVAPISAGAGLGFARGGLAGGIGGGLAGAGVAGATVCLSDFI